MDFDQLVRHGAQAAQEPLPIHAGRVNRITGSDVFVVIPSLTENYEHGPVKSISVGSANLGDECLVLFDDDGTPWVVNQGTTAAGSGDLHLHIPVTVASPVWTLNHNLGKFPDPRTFDSAGTEWEGEVAYLDANTLTVTFHNVGSGFTGDAYLN